MVFVNFFCIFAPHFNRMTHLLDDIVFADSLRYESHSLVYSLRQDADEAKLVYVKGVMGAALLSVLLVDTPEGDRRGIVLDSAEGREEWYTRYEREIRRDDWGMLRVESELLCETYLQLDICNIELTAFCSNIRLLDVAMQMVAGYMQRLVVEIYGAHIWEGLAWRVPFAQWLFDAASLETYRQILLHTNWKDPKSVNDMMAFDAEKADPTLYFEGEAAADIMKRYFNWMWTTCQTQMSEVPGVKSDSAEYKKYVLGQETNSTFLSEEVEALDDNAKELWQRWMNEWQRFITRQLKPEREIRFWVAGLSDEMEERLLDYLRLQERQPMHYKCLTAAVYALRQLGYVRRACSVRDMERWLSERLSFDYTAKNNAMQFTRAWNQHGRYSEAVQDEIYLLKQYGITRRQVSDDLKHQLSQEI